MPRGVDKECPLTPGPDREQTPQHEVRVWRADKNSGSAGREIHEEASGCDGDWGKSLGAQFHERAFVAAAARPAEFPVFRLGQLGSVYGNGVKPGFRGRV